MKCFQGTALNINASILGKVTKKSRQPWFSRAKAPLVYATPSATETLPTAQGYLFAEHHPQKGHIKAGVVYGLKKEELAELNEGDVVQIESDGKVNVLYEITSHQNAIFATNRCNLNCVMCPQPPAPDRDNKTETNLTLIRMMDPERTAALAITGGEPTLLGEEFLKLVAACKQHLPKTALTLLTNGKKFQDLEFVRSLVTIGHPNLTIAMPLYSDIDEIHDRIVGVPRSFYEVIRGLHNLALFRQRVEIRTVIHSLTVQRLPNLAEFIYRNLPFVYHVALMGLEVTGHARRNIEMLWVDPADYSGQLLKSSKILNRGNMHFSIYNHQLCVVPRPLWRFCRKSISGWKNVYLPQCYACSAKADCGGFFETSGSYQSSRIQPVPC